MAVEGKGRKESRGEMVMGQSALRLLAYFYVNADSLVIYRPYAFAISEFLCLRFYIRGVKRMHMRRRIGVRRRAGVRSLA